MAKSIDIRVIDPFSLDENTVRIWRYLLAASDQLKSPFFTPGFAQFMARCRDDVKIGLIEQDRTIIGILPFHKKRSGVAAPIGGHVCDYQAIIGTLPDGLTEQELLKALGVSAFDFNHALSDQSVFRRSAFQLSVSRRVDLREGYESWVDTAKQSGSAVKNTQRKARKIARELGPLTFQYQDASDEAWDQFLVWKAQALNLDVQTMLSPTWVREVFFGIRKLQSEDFSGVFSTLYAGDQLVAAHFGLQSDRALHWWFPTYDPTLGKYSPGLIHLMCSIEHVAKIGLDELDFGRGEARYKHEFSNDARGLCEGSLERIGTSAGVARRFRKLGQRAIDKTLPDQVGKFTMRLGNRWLMAGRLD
ncbi:MAG: GNAT family N-acetyltransferase [Henriciella sp.]|nr:GNAT family N-acetyltransferase [Henriciella sp.]